MGRLACERYNNPAPILEKKATGELLHRIRMGAFSQCRTSSMVNVVSSTVCQFCPTEEGGFCLETMRPHFSITYSSSSYGVRSTATTNQVSRGIGGLHPPWVTSINLLQTTLLSNITYLSIAQISRILRTAAHITPKQWQRQEGHFLQAENTLKSSEPQWFKTSLSVTHLM